MQDPAEQYCGVCDMLIYFRFLNTSTTQPASATLTVPKVTVPVLGFVFSLITVFSPASEVFVSAWTGTAAEHSIMVQHNREISFFLKPPHSFTDDIIILSVIFLCHYFITLPSQFQDAH